MKYSDDLLESESQSPALGNGSMKSTRGTNPSVLIKQWGLGQTRHHNLRMGPNNVVCSGQMKDSTRDTGKRF